MLYELNMAVKTTCPWTSKGRKDM